MSVNLKALLMRRFWANQMIGHWVLAREDFYIGRKKILTENRNFDFGIEFMTENRYVLFRETVTSCIKTENGEWKLDNKGELSLYVFHGNDTFTRSATVKSCWGEVMECMMDYNTIPRLIRDYDTRKMDSDFCILTFFRRRT
ncbi:MAG: hypothetical protein J5732_04240 [Bacteroidaceae bacterium]|nr:hypothetical protein [Bacteroidaceae bacterium]